MPNIEYGYSYYKYCHNKLLKMGIINTVINNSFYD